MRIALVDDEAAERQKLGEQIRLLLKSRRSESQILEYENGQDFLADAGESPFDLVFLDIYMKGPDGVETARRLRAFDRKCLLVFTTVSKDHALEGYRVRAFQYLIKPCSLRDLEQLFEELGGYFAPEAAILIRAGRQELRLRPGQILWAEHFQHKILIHTESGREFAVRMNFSEFIRLFAGDIRFFVCGRGVLVNLSHADDFDGTDFRLSDGTKVPVSRSLAGVARAAFAEYLFRKEAPR